MENNKENNKENKARYFAQYYGQEVLKFDDHFNDFKIDGVYLSTSLDEGYILLTPLSNITDEDAIEVAKLCGWQGRNKEVLIGIGKDCIKNDHSSDYELYIEAYQYLQSKGYALPFMDLSIEDLINYGWLKLKAE